MQDRNYIQHRSNESGRSLVETVMVFMIAGIVMAFSLPAVATSIRAYNLRSAANHLAERLSSARSLAMTKNKNVTFSFNKATGLYGLDFTPTPDGIPDETDPDDPSIVYYTELLSDSIALAAEHTGNVTITFNSRGELPIGSADQQLTIESDSKSASVHVNLRGKIWVD